MVKITAALALFCAIAAPAFAGPCVALDYQEMKDMTVDELATAVCKAREARRQSLDDAIATRDERNASSTHDNFDQCTGQIERVERVLTSKGVSKDAMKALCSKQATSN